MVQRSGESAWKFRNRETCSLTCRAIKANRERQAPANRTVTPERGDPFAGIWFGGRNAHDPGDNYGEKPARPETTVARGSSLE